MKCEQHLALEAVLVGLRRSGTIDRRTVELIVESLRDTAMKAEPYCSESAKGLTNLADALAKGPGRSCTISVAA